MMTNEQKLKRASELNELISPLRLEKMTSSLKYNFHNDNFLRTQNEESKKIADEEMVKIKAAEEKLLPLLQEIKSLQTDYVIEYDALIIENGFPNPKRNSLRISIPFYYLIDTKANGIDTADLSQMFLVKEALLFIKHQIVSDPTLISIKTVTE